MPFLILGAGFTGLRVARQLAAAGHTITATTRKPAGSFAAGQADVTSFPFEWHPDVEPVLPVPPPGTRWRTLLSLPSVKTSGGLVDPTSSLVAAVAPMSERLVYLSTTGVYGGTPRVDAQTPIDPVTERQRLRARAEEAVLSAGPPAMVLRPAAIYGPGRGVHQAIREGRFPLVGDGSNYTSRIHVDDLAALATAALLSDAAGAYPVADDLPSTSREIASFCCELLGLPLPVSIPAESAHETRRANRKVDGSAIRELLGHALQYPTYREGIPASIAADGLATTHS